MSKDLLPTGSTQLERAASEATVIIGGIRVPLRTLWNPQQCPLPLLPYLAWTFSVDRWDDNWPEETKRQVIADSYRIHKLKGTIAALRHTVEPFGYLIRVIEWWQENGTPGTFRLEIGASEDGIDADTYYEMERLIADARPVSRHLVGLNIILEAPGEMFTGGVSYTGDTITVYAE
ncbi:phage tail protein I [Salmonella enterica subsp. enterica serovar Adelaide]|nr:phage tail protein I [Salmonella enterica subsp. enterica serovar Adelaide]